MFFKNVQLSSSFFSNRKINKAENEIVLRLSNQKSYELLDKIYNSPKCKCGERFYSVEGLKIHTCRIIGQGLATELNGGASDEQS